MLQKHREHRNEIFFTKSLRNEKMEFGTSKTKLLNECELMQQKIKKSSQGLQFIDFSNNMQPKLCECVCDSLREDKYVSYVNLEGNLIDMD